MRPSWCLPLVLLLSSCVTGVSPKEAAQLYYDLGNAYTRLGEQDKATTAYLHALKLDSTLLQASYNLARAYIETGQYANATTLLNQLLSKDPRNVILLGTLGYDYYKQNELDRALGYYHTLLTFSPADENALFNTGVILEKQGKNKEALEAFGKVYELTSDYTVLSHMGMIEIALGDDQAAIKYLEAYREKKPDDFDALVALGRTYQKEKLYDRALSVYDAALTVKPNAAPVLFDRAVILLTAIDDADNGFRALSAAIDAGFNDQGKIKALADDFSLVAADKVRAYLSDKKLLNDSTPAAPPTATGAKGGETPPAGSR